MVVAGAGGAAQMDGKREEKKNGLSFETQAALGPR